MWRWEVARLAATAILTVSACATPASAQSIPAGWEHPSDADLAGPNLQFRAGHPSRYLRAEGDFDGDGKPDRAELLVNRALQASALFVFPASGAPVELDRFKLSMIEAIGIRTEKPGRRQTTCGKGYEAADPKCEKGIPFIDVRHHSIGLTAFESSSSEYYWSGAKFEKFWTSD